jgi:hypothetical protein
MRMIHYFAAGVLCAVPALFLTAWLGIDGRREAHVLAGLITTMLVGAVHTLVILFMLVTGRVLREGMRTRSLPPAMLAELNEFFARRRAYPLAILAALAIVVAGVLGQAGRALGLPPAVHMLAGIVAMFVNLWAFGEEARILRANQGLIDRAAVALDAIDRELAARGTPLEFEEPPLDARRVARSALVVAIAAWLPYLYWGLIVWRGRFDKVSPHPWLEISLVAAIVWLVASRKRARAS